MGFLPPPIVPSVHLPPPGQGGGAESGSYGFGLRCPERGVEGGLGIRWAGDVSFGHWQLF